MKSQWTNIHPDKKTRRLFKMRDIYQKECYAILTYDIMMKRKKIRCWVVHLDVKRKQLVIKITKDVFPWFLKQESAPVTISLVTAYISFALFVVSFNTAIVVTYSNTNLVFNFQEIKKMKMKDEQKLIRRHLDSGDDDD